MHPHPDKKGNPMNSFKRIATIFAVVLTTIFLAVVVEARPKSSVKNVLMRDENPREGAKTFLALPYVFSTDSMGFTAGAGGFTKGYGQEQLLVGATAFASVDEAVGLFLGMWDYRPSFTKRFFFGAQGMVGHYPRQRGYSALFFDPDISRPGSNDSNKDQFEEESGFDNWTDFRLEYVLPIGSGRKEALQHYKIKNGLLVSDPVGGNTWNPLKGGVTNVMLRQFNRFRNFEFEDGEIGGAIHPVELGIAYYNTDWPTNPSVGSSQYLSITQDFGWLESPDTWTFIEFEASKYFSLGDSNWARQRIVALNFWTGDSPSWNEDTLPDGRIDVTNRPPFYEGATLGGFYRMRGYPVDRFNDRSVIYATAEYRYTLKWNPIPRISWLNFLQSDWIQLVPFIEGGRVANEYNASTFFKDWKLDGGLGFRFLFAGSVVRLDFAVSDESTGIWAMFGHPF
jgi:Omp85 superfamily domain